MELLFEKYIKLLLRNLAFLIMLNIIFIVIPIKTIRYMYKQWYTTKEDEKNLLTSQ